MNPYNFSVLCFGFCSLLVGLFVWLKRQDRVGQLYLLLCLVYAGWALPFSIKISDNVSYSVALHAARIANCSAAFIPTLWLHFCLVYTGRSQIHRKLLRALYCVPFLILAASYTPWFVTGLRPILSFKYYAIPGVFYYLMTLNYFLVLPLGFVQLIKKMKETSDAEKRQLLGLFWVSCVAYLSGGTTFLPIYGIAFPQEGMFLIPFYPFVLAYFIIRTRLFDLEELAQAAHRDKLTAIGVLAASINHEVKNPLFIIKGLAETWLERKKEKVFRDDKETLEKGEETMKRSIEQADRAMDIIKRLSLFAKAGIESEINLEPVKLSTVLEDILPLVRHELAANNIVLTREIPNDLPEVLVDRRYLEEIFFNLIVNAIQALKGVGKAGESFDIAQDDASGKRAPEGQIMISATTPSPRLSLGERDGVRGSRNVIISVQDNGPGILEDKLKDVFRPFYTTKEEGTGLGLYITQQLVEKIKGRIDVQSTLGQGTVFTTLLPAFAPENHAGKS